MERFILTTKTGRAGKVDLVLEMHGAAPGAARDVVRAWKVRYTGGNNETQARTPLKVAERRGMLFNAEKLDGAATAFPASFDGSAREFANVLSDRGYKVGGLGLEHAEGMRLALAFMLAGRCNTVGRMHAVADGLTNLEPEVVLYWFTLCAYGRRTKAGRAALFTLCNTKG